MKTIELFSGTGSFSKIAKKRGHSIFTLDIDKRFAPSLIMDILNVSISDLPTNINVLWASPPCNCFSVASISKSWCGNYSPSRTETALAMAYVLKTLKIIKILKPNYWFIENPRGVLRKMGFMAGLHRKTVTYCQYGDSRMKPTDIWTNLVEWQPKPMCKNGDTCHISAPRGAKTGTQGLKSSIERSIIPSAIFNEIFEIIEDGEINK